MTDPRTPEPDAPRLLRLREAAERVGVSYRTVQAWVASGRLKVVRLSRRVVRVEAAELERWIAEARR